MSHQHASDEMARQLRTAGFTYLDTIEPVRPALYRYRRRRTRDMWDTEDLLQETTRKVAIVTGASGGIGRAIAERLAHDGVSVVINYARSGKEAKSALPTSSVHDLHTATAMSQ
jgi:D-arabinose 5-phosphate isomerase GutQ